MPPRDYFLTPQYVHDTFILLEAQAAGCGGLEEREVVDIWVTANQEKVWHYVPGAADDESDVRLNVRPPSPPPPPPLSPYPPPPPPLSPPRQERHPPCRRLHCARLLRFAPISMPCSIRLSRPANSSALSLVCCSC